MICGARLCSGPASVRAAASYPLAIGVECAGVDCANSVNGRAAATLLPAQCAACSTNRCPSNLPNAPSPQCGRSAHRSTILRATGRHRRSMRCIEITDQLRRANDTAPVTGWRHVGAGLAHWAAHKRRAPGARRHVVRNAPVLTAEDIPPPGAAQERSRTAARPGGDRSRHRARCDAGGETAAQCRSRHDQTQSNIRTSESRMGGGMSRPRSSCEQFAPGEAALSGDIGGAVGSAGAG